jgi:hypothetical protein
LTACRSSFTTIGLSQSSILAMNPADFIAHLPA